MPPMCMEYNFHVYDIFLVVYLGQGLLSCSEICVANSKTTSKKGLVDLRPDTLKLQNTNDIPTKSFQNLLRMREDIATDITVNRVIVTL